MLDKMSTMLFELSRGMNADWLAVKALSSKRVENSGLEAGIN